MILVLAAFVSFGLALEPAAAHSGGLDRYGCHAGSQPYHCHRGSGPSPSPSPAPAPTTEPPDTRPPPSPTVSVTHGSASVAPSISVGAEAGALVQVFAGDGSLIDQWTSQGFGPVATTRTLRLGEGSHRLRATATDAAGNTSTGARFTVEVNRVPPAAAVIGVLTGTASDPETVFRVSSEEGSTVTLVLTGPMQEELAVRVGNEGVGEVQRLLANGSYEIEWLTTDAVGNQTGPERQAFTVEVSPPQIAEVSVESEPGAPVWLATVASQGVAVVASIDGQAGSPIELEAGVATLELTLDDGEHTIEVVALDVLGQASPPVVVIGSTDTVGPEFRVDVDKGLAAGGQLMLTVATEPGAVVTVETSAGVVSATADENGVAVLDLGQVGDGEGLAQVEVMDPFGNLVAGTVDYAVSSSSGNSPLKLMFLAGGAAVIAGAVALGRRRVPVGRRQALNPAGPSLAIGAPPGADEDSARRLRRMRNDDSPGVEGLPRRPAGGSGEGPSGIDGLPRRPRGGPA